MTPVFQKTGCFRRDLLQVVWQSAPLVHLLAKFVNDRSRIVLLLLCRKPFPFVEYDLLLSGRSSALLWLRDRSDEFCAPTPLDDFLCGLSVIKLPVARRVFVRRIQNGVFEERI